MDLRRLRSRWCRLLAAVGIAIGLSSTAIGSDLLLGNYPPANDVDVSSLLSGQRRKAIEFSIPSGFSYVVNSITLRLSSYDGSDFANLQIRSHNGTGTSPGSSIVGLLTAPPGTSSTFTDYVFTPFGTINLLADTKYWLYLYGAGTPSANNFNWRGSSPPITPTGIADFGPGNLFSDTSGATWVSSPTINTFMIEGTVVPEPGAFALLGLGGICILHRRRTASTTQSL